MSVITPNTDEAIQFLQQWPAAYPHLTAIHLDPETGEKGLIEARAFHPVDGEIDWDAVRKWIDARQGKANLYFTVNSLRAAIDKKASKADIAEVVALHVDIDVPAGEDQEATAATLISRVFKHDPMPSFIISSGGGVQGFWVLEPGARVRIDGDVDKAEAVERYTRGLEDAFSAERGAKADRCHNVDRIMRLPGTINVPDHKKLEKGRKPALAKLAASTGKMYALGSFTPAGPKDMVPTPSGVPAEKPVDRLKVKVDWGTAEELWNTIDLEHMRDKGVEEHALISLEFGGDRESLHEHHTRIGHRVAEGPYPSHSEISMAVATALLRAGYSYEECAVIMCSNKFPGNKHQTKEKNKAKLRREVERTLGKAAADIQNSGARARATAAGIPIWASCYDKAGLYPRHEVPNVEIALKALGFGAKLDLFHDRIVLTYDGQERLLQESVSDHLTDRAENAICKHMINVFKFDPGDTLLHRTLMQMATEHAFDPVCDYLNAVQPTWDGVKRLDTWVITYLGCEDTPLNRAIGRCSLLATVRRARVPGCKYDCITVLEGREGTQKSTAIETLAGRENFSDQTILGVSDREAQELLRGVWMFECADLSGMARAEVERTKAFASRTVDRARKAYGRSVEEQPRRCTIWATTNDDTYLISQTGNRRFLPLRTSEINLDALRRDRDQLWAEAAVREAAGEAIILEPALWGAAAEAQEERRAVDPWETLVGNMPAMVTHHDGVGRQEVRVVWEHNDGEFAWDLVATATVLEHVLRITPGNQSTAHAKRLAVAMGKAGWERTKNGLVRINNQSVRGYRRKADPTRASKNDNPVRSEAVGPATQADQKSLVPF